MRTLTRRLLVGSSYCSTGDSFLRDSFLLDCEFHPLRLSDHIIIYISSLRISSIRLFRSDIPFASALTVVGVGQAGSSSLGAFQSKCLYFCMSFMFFAERYFPWPTLTNIGNWNFFSRFVTGSRHPLLTDFILSTKGGDF